MSPRSILKRASPQAVASTSTSTHAVHFPPSPSLCRTFAAYSPSMYDRTPIVVDKNTCALPERGCPGRTYVLEEQQARQQQAARSASYHPRALNGTTQYRPVDGQYSQYSRASLQDLPQLVPDFSSSESDESDGLSSSPSIPAYLYSYGANGLPTKYEQHDYDSYSKNSINAISFLPYPPSPPANYSCNSNSDAQSPKPRKKRSSSSSRHDGSTDPDRIQSGASESKSSRRREYLLSHGGGFGARDDGCLGGF
ncbi:hypothetical protein EST38_g5711 [Candolleomyces aberdarensis]|uniref:Uncharacterized protein n=1 Tax=Candolleomyces aberdarensis TaxID=2316362 RepID=A0A4Q2DN24_9AGAR|nr:hypothetical protein EST38_g5711 [Candolleomyces aberdarensis]